MVLDYILQYAPYVLIALNAIMSMLTYRKTGKVFGYSKDNPVNIVNDKKDIVKDDIQNLLDYHKTQYELLQEYINGGDNNG